jgi:hypothetical protein
LTTSTVTAFDLPPPGAGVVARIVSVPSYATSVRVSVTDSRFGESTCVVRGWPLTVPTVAPADGLAARRLLADQGL